MLKSQRKKNIYPKLPAVRDCLLFRLGGNGLANCLFIYARAIIESEKSGGKIITPTWFNVSPGTYLRTQRDKRHYLQIFKSEEITLPKKLFLLFLKSNNVHIIEGLGNYFVDLYGCSALVRQHIKQHLADSVSANLPASLPNVVALHVRLGDYPKEKRVALSWYKDIIEKITDIHGNKYVFHLFSDGSDKELEELLQIKQLSRVDNGLAIHDLWALSQAKLIIASDSTFSAWGAYLLQTPILFKNRHFPPVLDEQEKELVAGTAFDSVTHFLKKFL